MSAETFLARLGRVRRTSKDQWSACCPVPAHDDKGPSLSVRELPDGRTLVHCFAGCGVYEVLAAVGLEMDALFPEKPGAGLFNHGRPERRPFNAHDALRALAHEVTVVRLCAGVMRDGDALSDTDDARLSTAFTRIVAAETLINAR